MKTVRVVAAVIKAVNENGEPIILQHRGDMANLKMAGNFQVAKLKKGKLHKMH